MQELQLLPNDFGSRLVKLRYQALYVETINHHVEEGNQKLKRTLGSQTVKKLNDDEFWFDLIQRFPLSTKLENLAQFWKAIQGFEHLSTRELICLFKEDLRPLETALLRAVQELELDQEHHKYFGFWRPKWYRNKQQAILDCLNEQLERVSDLKLKVQQALIARTLAYDLLNIDRHDDNLMLGLIVQLKEFVQIEPDSFQAPQNCLSDDERLEIFDLLANSPKGKEKYYSIVHDVRKAYFNPVVENSKMIESAQDIESKIAMIEESNQLLSIAKFRRLRESKSQKSESALYEIVLKYLKSTTLASFIKTIYRMRYIIATSITLSLFFTFVPALVSFLSFYSKAVADLSFIGLFFGFGLAPAWVGSWQWIKKSYQNIADTICYDKRQSLHQALELIKENQIVIAELLTQGIHDPAHADLNRIERFVEKFKNSTGQIMDKTSQLGTFEKLFASEKLRKGLSSAKFLLMHQERIVSKRLSAYAKHIVNRAKSDITKLIWRADSGYQLLIKPDQIHQLQNFICKHGTKNDLDAFSSNVTLMPQFVERLIDRKFLINAKTSSNTPWGGLKPFHCSINGWEILLKQSGPPHELDRLLGVLKGEEAINFQELRQLVMNIDCHADDLLYAIQSHIFACLDFMPKEYVNLLTIEQKRLVNSWSQENKEQIDRAMKALNKFVQIHEVGSQQDISNYISLLDGAVLASILNNKSPEPYNIARNALAKYDGKDPRMYYLMRFYAESEKPDVITKIANKRIEYLLNHPKTKLNDIDKEIFINVRHIIGYRFNFSSFVKKHLTFGNPWSKPFEKLLRKFKKAGLDSGELLDVYNKMNQNVKIYKTSRNENFRESTKEVAVYA